MPDKRTRKLEKAAAIEEPLSADEFRRLWEEFYRSIPMTKKDIARADAIYRRLMRPRAGARPGPAAVTERVAERLDDAEVERQWKEFVRGVAPSRADVRWAEAVVRRARQRPKGRRAA